MVDDDPLDDVDEVHRRERDLEPVVVQRRHRDRSSPRRSSRAALRWMTLEDLIWVVSSSMRSRSVVSRTEADTSSPESVSSGESEISTGSLALRRSPLGD